MCQFSQLSQLNLKTSWTITPLRCAVPPYYSYQDTKSQVNRLLVVCCKGSSPKCNIPSRFPTSSKGDSSQALPTCNAWNPQKRVPQKGFPLKNADHANRQQCKVLGSCPSVSGENFLNGKTLAEGKPALFTEGRPRSCF